MAPRPSPTSISSGLTGKPTSSSPYVESHQDRIKQLINKYRSPSSDLWSATMQSAPPGPLSAMQTLDRARVARGSTPYTQTESAIGVSAATRNAPVVERPDQPFWQDVTSNIGSLVSGIPKLPGLMYNEGRELATLPDKIDDALSPNASLGQRVGNIANLPGVRMVPGSFVAGAFGEGHEGVTELYNNPVYTALDLLPYASKSARLSKTVRLAEELAPKNASLLRDAGYLSPDTRVAPISTLIKHWNPGEQRTVPLADRYGKVIEGGEMLGRNKIGESLARSHQRFTNSSVGNWFQRAGGAGSRDMAQMAADSTSRKIVHEMENGAPGSEGWLTAEAHRIAKGTDIAPSRSTELYKATVAATDRQSFLDSLKGEERAYVSELMDIQDQATELSIQRGDLTRTAVEGADEILPVRDAKLYQKVEARRDFTRAQNARRAALDDLDVDPDAAVNLFNELADIANPESFYPNMSSRKAALRANVTRLDAAGYDVAGLRKAVNKIDTRASLDRFRSDLGSGWSRADIDVMGRRSSTVLDDLEAQLAPLAKDDKLTIQALDRLKRQDWKGAKERLKAISKRTKSARDDIDWPAVRAELDARIALDRTRAQLDVHGGSAKALSTWEANYAKTLGGIAPARFTDYIRKHADEQFLREVGDKLNPEQKAAAADAIATRMISQLDNIAGVDDNLVRLYHDMYAESRAQWVKFRDEGIDPFYVHKVSPAEARRMQHPFVLNKEPGQLSGTKKRGETIETFEGVPDIAISVSHFAYEMLQKDATVDFLGRVEQVFGANGADLQVRYRSAADAVAKHTGRDVEGVLAEMIAREWSPFDPRKMIAGSKYGPKVAYAKSETLIPKALAQNLEAMLPGPESGIGKLFGAPMAVFRTAVLPLSPRWHSNNIMSGGVLYGLSSPRSIMDLLVFGREAWKMAREGTYREIAGAPGADSLKESVMWGRTATDAARLPLSQRLVIAQQHAGGGTMSRLMQGAVDHLGDRGIKWISKVTDAAGKGVSWSYNFNALFDDLYRSAAYLSGQADAIRKGMSKADAELAGVNLSREILQNWDRMTPIERGIIRNIFPFYSWASHITRFMRRYPGDHPWRLSVMARFSENEWNDHLSGVPERLRDLFWIGDVDGSGDVTGINVAAFNPFKDTANYAALAGFLGGQQGGDLSAVTSQLNPFISTIMQTIGIDPTRGSDLYPDLEYDPTTGGLRVGTGNFPSMIVGNIIPQTRTITDLAFGSQEFRALAQSNPDAAARRLASGIGMPILTKTYDMNEEQIKNEVTVYRQMMADRADAMRTGDWEKMNQWPALRAFYDSQIQTMTPGERKLGTPNPPDNSVWGMLFSGLTGKPLPQGAVSGAR